MPTSSEHDSPRKVDINDLILKDVGYYWNTSTLDLIPSRLELASSLKNPTGKERRLAKEIAKISDDYDLIIIDCAPTESILTEAAYFASRYALVPVKPEFMATIGLPLLARSIEEFKSLVSQRFIEQIQLVSHIVDLHFAVIFRNYLI